MKLGGERQARPPSHVGHPRGGRGDRALRRGVRLCRGGGFAAAAVSHHDDDDDDDNDGTDEQRRLVVEPRQPDLWHLTDHDRFLPVVVLVPSHRGRTT